MIECRSCRALFRASADQIGARCPKCHAPLFERTERPAVKLTDLGDCLQHPGSPAVVTCQRCEQALCGVCRTRWFGATLCPSCVTAAVRSDEPNPREMRRLSSRATWSFTLALLGWIIFALVLLPLFLQRQPGGVTWALVFGIMSLFPAVFAVGHGCAVVFVRGPRNQLAHAGMIMSSAHLGLFLGLFLLNLWHN